MTDAGKIDVKAASVTGAELKRQNLAFEDTPGVSANNAASGYVPAFRDSATGEVCLSRNIGGGIAPIHLLDGLPDSWVVKRTRAGRVAGIKSSVVAGFVRDEQFFTREEVAEMSD